MKYLYVWNVYGEFKVFEGVKKSDVKSGCIILYTPECGFKYGVYDIESGLAVRRFNRYKDAKDYFEGVKFIDDLPQINHARKGEFYKKSKKLIEDYRNEKL